jgi:flagellar basal body-associated protein FliL
MITTEQNTERQLQRLGAQRQLYATAKNILGWQIILGCPVAVISTILVVIDPSLKGLAAGWGMLVMFADIFWMTPWQKHLRDSAARIQEAFDCDVLDLPWNELKAGKRPDPELIKEQSDKYMKWGARMPPITNWYAPVVGDLPIHIGRVACQRTNCWWDAKQRRRYAACVIGIVVLIFVLVLGMALVTGFTIENFLIKVVAPLAPAFTLGIRQYREQTEAAARLDRLKEHSDSLWKDALSGKSKTALSTKSRNLQDEILENRRKSPPVFDFIFKRLRPKYEQQMNYGSEELVEQAKLKLNIA